MKAKGSSTGADFKKELCPAGSFPARLVKVIDMGEQYNEKFEKLNYQVALSWELPTQLLTEGDYAGKPFLISRTVTNSMHPKATLRGLIGGWMGNLSDKEAGDFDLFKLVGQPCMLSVVHAQVADKTYANIGGVMKLPDGLSCPEQVTDSVQFDLDSFNAEVYDSLPEWQREKISGAKNFAKSTEGGVPTDTDEPPF